MAGFGSVVQRFVTELADFNGISVRSGAGLVCCENFPVGGDNDDGALKRVDRLNE